MLAGTVPPASAAKDDPEVRLENVRKRIRELDQRLNETRMKHDKLATGLRDRKSVV